MKRTIPAAAAVAVVLVALVYAHTARSEPNAQTPGEKPQKVVVHLSHFTDDLHRCFMAFKLANLTQEFDADVTIFLDLEGVRVAERRQQLDLTWGSDSKQLGQLYEEFIEGGGKVMLCPHCAKSAKIGDMALKRNATIATMPELGKLLMEADKIMDY